MVRVFSKKLAWVQGALFFAFTFSLFASLMLAAGPAWAEQESGVSFESYSMYSYREASCGIPPNAEQSTSGCHFVIEASYPDELSLSDADAAAASFMTKGQIKGEIGSISYIEVSAEECTLCVDVCTGHLPGGDVTISAMTVDGVTCAGQSVAWPDFYTIVPTGLAFHTVEVVMGTEDTCASTTVQIDHQANIRSMNHILWTSNGSSIISGTGVDQTSTAHHHNYWSFTLADSADSIKTYSSTVGGGVFGNF